MATHSSSIAGPQPSQHQSNPNSLHSSIPSNIHDISLKPMECYASRPVTKFEKLNKIGISIKHKKKRSMFLYILSAIKQC